MAKYEIKVDAILTGWVIVNADNHLDAKTQFEDNKMEFIRNSIREHYLGGRELELINIQNSDAYELEAN